MPENPVISESEFTDRLLEVTRALMSQSDAADRIRSSDYGIPDKALAEILTNLFLMQVTHTGFSAGGIIDCMGKIFLMGVVYARQEIANDPVQA